MLNECFEEICDESKKRSLSHGFRKKHSIITNAKNHKNKRYVFNVDLEAFFPSINFGRVRGFFIKSQHFALKQKVATVIAQIACHNNELPQGSPCSPIISNLIGHLLDVRMVSLAKKTKCTYSRYADDLTFSTNKKEFPSQIAIRKNDIWVAGNRLIKEIEKVGFSLNTKKTSMQFKTSRQMTTGLVVNEKVNIRREYYKYARSMCHALFKTGEFHIDNREDLLLIKTNNLEEENNKGTLNQLEGILGFIYHIKRPYDDAKPKTRLYHPNAITKLYRSFLFYKHFFSMEMPVVICEGKTDIIYLKCALKHLSSSYKDFVEVNENYTDYKIKFLNLSNNFRDVLSIAKGTSGIEKLMEIYEKNLKNFNGNDSELFPVIIIIDNDDGSKEIKKNNLKIKKKAPPEPFYYFAKNLYVLIIPNAKTGAIEDLFDSETISMKIDGKSFNRSNRSKGIDSKKEYGKTVFAEKVIRANQQRINFEGFKEIFEGFRLIIDDYRKRK